MRKRRRVSVPAGCGELSKCKRHAEAMEERRERQTVKTRSSSSPTVSPATEPGDPDWSCGQAIVHYHRLGCHAKEAGEYDWFNTRTHST